MKQIIVGLVVGIIVITGGALGVKAANYAYSTTEAATSTTVNPEENEIEENDDYEDDVEENDSYEDDNEENESEENEDHDDEDESEEDED